MKYIILLLSLALTMPSHALMSTELDTLTDTVMDYDDQLPFYSFLNYLVKKETQPEHLEYLANLFIASFSMNKLVVLDEIIYIQSIIIADRIFEEMENDN